MLNKLATNLSDEKFREILEQLPNKNHNSLYC